MKKARTSLALATLMFSQAAFAQTGALESSVSRAISFGTKILMAVAAFLVLYGVIMGAVSIAQSEMDGKKKAAGAIVGGLLVATASKIVGALFELGQ
jgi:hypothetical protein